jgi:predicted SnoaL-like aldol condensation-catalyzing enzyme
MDSDLAKAIVQRYFHQLLNERDISVCEELLAPAYIDHDAPAGTPAGPGATKEFVAAFLEKYPNLEVDVMDMVAEANKVAARIIWRGTQRDTAIPFHQMGIVIIRLNEQGQFMERWSAYTALIQP